MANKRGAKSKYETCVKPYLSEINEKVRQGVIEEEIAQALGISVATLNNYKLKHPELREALSKDKGADVLQKLKNAGLESAMGYYRENETTTIILDLDGKPIKKQKTINKIWYPANASMHKIYLDNFGKETGFISNPTDYELRKAKQELDEEVVKSKNWNIFDE